MTETEVKEGRASARQEQYRWQEIEMLAQPGYGIGEMELFLVTLESEMDVCP